MAGLTDRLARLFTTYPDAGGSEDRLRAEGRAPGNQPRPVTSTGAAERHPTPRDPIDDVLAQKLLAGWTANRAQTLHPLTMNLSRLDEPGATLVLQTVALAVLAGGPSGRSRTGRAAAWLRRVNGTAQHQALLHDALETPPVLNVVLEQVKAMDLAGHAYAATLGATDQRNLVSRRFADYLAARLGIPADMGRSLGRRYRS